MKYTFSEFCKNVYNLALTKIFYPSARLIRRPFYLRGNRNGVLFGEGFTCGYDCRLEVLSNDKTSMVFGKNCKIGDRVHVVSSDSVVIGDDCLFASNVFISDTNHGDGFDDPLTPPDLRPLTSASVSVGKCVWLGEGVAVLPGSEVGDGSIIGAHSVVKGKIPAYSVAVGSPARVVKTYNFETRRWEKV